VARRSAIEVQGAKKLIRQINQLDNGLKQELKGVFIESAAIVYRRALPKVPVRSGRLKDTVRKSATTRQGSVKAGNAKVPYAGPIHFGWPNRPNYNKEWFGGPIAPNPFLYAALDERRDDVEFQFYKGLMKVARKAGLDPR